MVAVARLFLSRVRSAAVAVTCRQRATAAALVSLQRHGPAPIPYRRDGEREGRRGGRKRGNRSLRCVGCREGVIRRRAPVPARSGETWWWAAARSVGCREGVIRRRPPVPARSGETWRLAAARSAPGSGAARRLGLRHAAWEDALCLFLAKQKEHVQCGGRLLGNDTCTWSWCSTQHGPSSCWDWWWVCLHLLIHWSYLGIYAWHYLESKLRTSTADLFGILVHVFPRPRPSWL
ncbi:uncharacterized protein LOC119363058 [Triticum dicoccoides]|uniref:uncharacterized protein LOC119363058 n=1 Tax=Triticum dicoccoides TaxID=85692 RepID=UPI00188FD208|nr:uncharacterized protein LOC119363058 [Triticum dicoccoides]